jgi:hypothetical protein
MLFIILIPDFMFFVVTQVNLKFLHLCQSVSKIIATDIYAINTHRFNEKWLIL